MESAPNILFLNDFPPSNQNGGTVLIRRLLSGYPADNLIALTDAQNMISAFQFQMVRDTMRRCLPYWKRAASVFPASRPS